MSLTFPTGFKFSYSGDSRPCEEFVRIGKGSTVLLHEATFDDELQGDALAKKHSTTSEALGVGMAMGARRVVLTHFSQRYQKIPVMEDMGFMGVRLENIDETEASNNPTMDAEMTDLPAEAPQDNVVPQNSTTETSSILSSLVSNGPPDITGTSEISMMNTKTADLSTEVSQNHSVPQNDDNTETNSTLGDLVSNETSGVTVVASVPSTESPNAMPQATFPASVDPKSESSFVVTPSTVNDMKVCVAFDYMRVKVKDLAHMEKYTPALLELYQQDSTEDNAEEKVLSVEQDFDEREKKGKRKDGSDDEEPRKENKKKNNEKINRGKSKKQLQKEKSKNEKTEERKTRSKEEKQSAKDKSKNEKTEERKIQSKEEKQSAKDKSENEKIEERKAQSKEGKRQGKKSGKGAADTNVVLGLNSSQQDKQRGLKKPVLSGWDLILEKVAKRVESDVNRARHVVPSKSKNRKVLVEKKDYQRHAKDVVGMQV